MPTKITITIPDNLLPEHEALLVAQKLAQALPGGQGKQKRIGQEVNVRELTTEITIKRVGEKPIKTQECTCCGTIFDLSLSKKLWVNYGMQNKRLHYCSDECREKVFALCGEGRASKGSRAPKPLRFW